MDGYTEDNDFAKVLVLRSPRNPFLEIAERGPLSSRFSLPESAVELVTKDSVEQELRTQLEESIGEDARREDREEISKRLQDALAEIEMPVKHRNRVAAMISEVFDLQAP